MKRYILFITVAVVFLLAACAPANRPAQEAPLPSATSGAEMMHEGTPTQGVMMHETPTGESMMHDQTATPEGMMHETTSTPEAMMHETPAAEATMPQEAMMGPLPAATVVPQFSDSSPKQGDVLAHAPANVRISFTSALSMNSTIDIDKNGAMFNGGPATFGNGDKSISVALPGALGDGVYVVKYKACWTSGSCDNGQFAFRVDAATGK